MLSATLSLLTFRVVGDTVAGCPVAVLDGKPGSRLVGLGVNMAAAVAVGPAEAPLGVTQWLLGTED